MFANKILTLPSLLFEYGRSDSFLILLLMFLFDIAVLFVFFKLKQRYKTQSFFQVLSLNWGKFFAVLIYLLLFIYFFIKILTTFNVSYIYFKMQVYHNDQKSIFLFLALAVLAIMVANGFRPLSRTIQFFYPAILIGLLFCLLISFANFSHPPLLFTTPFKSLITGAYRYVFAFGDFLLLFLIMDRIEYKAEGRSQILKSVIVSMYITLVGYFLFFSIFEYTGFMHPNAVSDIIVLSYEIFDIGRLDIIAVVTVMLLTFCQISLYGYVLSSILLKVFPRMTKNYSIAIVITIFLIVYGLSLNSLDSVGYFVTNFMPLISIFLQYLLPILTLTFKQRGGRYEENYKSG